MPMIGHNARSREEAFPAPKLLEGLVRRIRSPQVFQTTVASPLLDLEHENTYVRGKPVVVVALQQCIQLQAP